MIGERTSADLAAMNSPESRKIAGMIRKLIVLFTKGGRWELQGFRVLNERVRPEVFQGVGFWSRPPANAKITAVVVSVGDSDNPVVIALRDEKTRQAVADALADNESLHYNTLAGVHVKADGTIHVRAHGGTAVALATLAELQALRDYVYNQFRATAGHVHTVVGAATTSMVASDGTGPGTPTPPTIAPPAPTGTTVLKGQ